jgi:hypothetical protein
VQSEKSHYSKLQSLKFSRQSLKTHSMQHMTGHVSRIFHFILFYLVAVSGTSKEQNLRSLFFSLKFTIHDSFFNCQNITKGRAAESEKEGTIITFSVSVFGPSCS